MGATNTTPHASIETKTCPECGTRVEHTRGQPGETTCPDCGLVLAEYSIDHGKDWRQFREDERDPRHAETNYQKHCHLGLGSEIGRPSERGDGDHRRHALSRQGYRKKDRNHTYATTDIHRMGTALGFVNPVIEDAKHHFTRLHSRGSLGGRDLDAITAGCLYASSRMHGTGRTPGDIEEVARCSERDISRRMWYVAQELGLEIPPPDVRARVRVVGGELGITRSRIRDALSDLPDDVSGVKPSGVVAAVLYENSHLTQEAVCGVAGCRPVTLRNSRDRIYNEDLEGGS